MKNMLKKILCKMGIHTEIIVVNDNLPYVKRYYAMCWICSKFLSLPLMGEIIR